MHPRAQELMVEFYSYVLFFGWCGALGVGPLGMSTLCTVLDAALTVEDNNIFQS